MVSVPDTPGILARLNAASPTILDMRLPALVDLASCLASDDRFPPPAFLNALSENSHADVLRACLLVYKLSSGKVLPRLFQLEVLLQSLAGRDCVVISGTGSGKTLVMIMLAILRPKEYSILVVPLKRLQHSQSDAFTAFSITAAVINEDTPDRPQFWQGIADGKYSTIITTMEQLGKHEGHMTRFGTILRALDRKYTNRVRRIFIDEAQNVYTAGIVRYNQPAFRPAYGHFDGFRLLFPKSTSVLAFSATMPPHIIPVVKKKLSLSPNLYILKRTCNRANIMYATHQIVGSLSDLRNLNCLVPPAASVTTPDQIPLIIVFHDDTKECSDAAAYLDSLLPLNMQDTGIVRHYHSLMSTEYSEKTYQAFQNGECRILHTCGGMESGIDFNRVDIVVQYGIASDETKTIQRGGRAGRDLKHRSLFLVMYEPWVKEVDLSKILAEELAEDPDRPLSVMPKKYYTKMERTSVESIRLIQCRICIRFFHAKYLNDDSPEALDFVTEHCCDRHDDGFCLQKWLPGEIWTGSVPVDKRPKKRTKKRPVKDRGPIEDALRVWRSNVLKSDPRLALASPDWVLHPDKIKALAEALPETLTTTTEIAELLCETEEWKERFAQSIFTTIQAKQPNQTPVRHPLVDQANLPPPRVRRT